MNQEKYIGMDVHLATISVAVMNGKLIMECILEVTDTVPRSQWGAESGALTVSGLDIEKESRPPVEGKLFLEIPFYRTH